MLNDDAGKRAAPELGLCTCGSALVRLLSCKGEALRSSGAAGASHLQFAALQSSATSSAGTGGGCAGDVWLLAPAGAPGSGRYTLREAAAPCRFLTAADGRLVLSEAAAKLELYMDMDRRVALRLPGKACLQAGAGGAALAGRLPLSRGDRAAKLFRLEEAALPSHSLRPWPLRAVLRLDAGGAGPGSYLSASGGGVAAATPVACCSEEWLLALGEGGRLSVAGSGGSGGVLTSPGCSVWAGDGRRLLSADACTGKVLLSPQHACHGGERFALQLSESGELSLLAERPQRFLKQQPAAQSGGDAADAAGGVPAAAAADAALAPVVVQPQQQGQLACRAGGGKPSRFTLELASGRPTLLLTAHGQLLGCAGHGGDRPCALLPPAAAAAAGTAGAARACPEAVRGAAWLLQHHGDSLYSLRHAASGRSLYVDGCGAPALDAPGADAALVFPDPRLLFWLEPNWVHSEARDSSSVGGSDESSCSSRTAAAAGAARGWAWPAARGGARGGLVAAGFTLRSLALVGGRHAYLSVLPDGLVTSVSAAGRPSRWELFSLIDHQASAADRAALVQSPLRLLDCLPCAAPAPAPPAMRRAASMQVLGSSLAGAPLAAGARRWGSHAALPRAPSLPAVHEHKAVPLDPHQGRAWEPCLPQQQQQRGACPATLPPRRSQSEGALAELQRRQQRPQWLAQLLAGPPRPAEGWGLHSPAPLQQLACRQLCASLAERCQAGGRQLAPGLVEAVERELCAHLPEEVAAAIGRELRLLAGPPAPTKPSLLDLGKAPAAAGSPDDDAAAAAYGAPAWAQPWLADAAAQGDPRWQPSEAFLCACCRGASGPLAPLDPWSNPTHHLFLAAAERRARGGGRVRLRARRRLDREDPLIAALKAGKLALLALAAARTLAALLAA